MSLSITASLWNSDTGSQHPRVSLSTRWAKRWSLKELGVLCTSPYHILSLIWHVLCFRSVGEGKKREWETDWLVVVVDVCVRINSSGEFFALIRYEKTTHTDAFENDNKAACRRNSRKLGGANACIWFKSAISESKHCERTAKRRPAALRISFHSLGSVGHPRAYVTQPAYSDDILLSAWCTDNNNQTNMCLIVRRHSLMLC